MDWFNLLPNHKFVVTTAIDMIWIGRSEDIISNVGSDISCVISPLDARGHASSSLHGDSFSQLATRIRVTLDIILCTLPHPIAAPSNAIPYCPIIIGTLRTRRRRILAPQVVQDFVSIGGMVSI